MMTWKLRTKQIIRRKYFSFLFKFRSSNLNRKLRQVSLIVACGSVNLKLIFLFFGIFRHNSRLLKFRFLEFFLLSLTLPILVHILVCMLNMASLLIIGCCFLHSISFFGLSLSSGFYFAA